MTKFTVNVRGKQVEVERLSNGKFKIPAISQFVTVMPSCTWLDDCRIPYQNEDDKWTPTKTEDFRSGNFVREGETKFIEGQMHECDQKGRFPANLLVSDDILNDHSRYFSLDKWFSTTFPFLICPKPSKKERNMGLIDSYFEPKKVNDGRQTPIDNPFQRGETPRINTHPTVKSIKLMSYLIMLGSREGDTILDPFCGSGTTMIAAQRLNRKHIGIEINKEYSQIAQARLVSITNKNTSIF